MQMDEFTFVLLKVTISVCAALVTAYVIPYIKALKNDARFAGIIDMIELAVRAAEQTITGKGQGKVKKAEVIRFVSAWLESNGIEMTVNELSQLIEAAVYAMKQEV